MARSSLSMFPEAKKGDSGPKLRGIDFQYGNSNCCFSSSSCSSIAMLFYLPLCMRERERERKLVNLNFNLNDTEPLKQEGSSAINKLWVRPVLLFRIFRSMSRPKNQSMLAIWAFFFFFFFLHLWAIIQDPTKKEKKKKGIFVDNSHAVLYCKK